MMARVIQGYGEKRPEVGVDDYVTKPFYPDHFHSALARRTKVPQERMAEFDFDGAQEYLKRIAAKLGISL